MSKQTSLELFAIRLYEAGLLIGSGDMIEDLLDEYHKIHRREIKNAVHYGMDSPYTEKYTWTPQGGFTHKGDIYYDNTYLKNK